MATLIRICFSILLLSLVVSGIKSYEMWGQVIVLWESKTNPLDIIAELHPHALRYSLTYPFFILSRELSTNYNTLFSLAVIWMFYSTIKNIEKTVSVIPSKIHNNRIFFLLVISILFFGLFYMMNGRIAFAFWGYSILLLCIMRLHFISDYSLKNVLLIMAGLFLCSVSSGTLISSSISFLMVCLASIFPIMFSKRRLKHSIVLILALILFWHTILNYVFVGVFKNLEYFGGGISAIYNMLDHGYGRIFYNAFDGAGAIAGFLVFGALFLWLVLSRTNYPMIHYIALSSLGCGAFGFSTLSLAAVPTAVLLGSYVKRVSFQKKLLREASPAA